MEVNVDAGRGDIAVEVLDDEGNALPGFTRQESNLLKGTDGVRLSPRWENQADLSRLKGRIVRLKFYLNEARLYAFQIKDGS